MKITAQEEYGLRCLLRLARAYGGQPLTIPEIAAAENLSQPYVGKLLGELRREGLIESVRGRAGGYHLARPPAEVRLGSVMLALGEPLFEGEGYCERHAGPETNGPCVHHDNCTIKGLWETLDGWLRHILDQVTLDDLMRNEMPVLRRLREQMPASPPTLLTLTPVARG
jgi:Rrf2 family protein